MSRRYLPLIGSYFGAYGGFSPDFVGRWLFDRPAQSGHLLTCGVL